jgi:hypothetical protein
MSYVDMVRGRGAVRTSFTRSPRSPSRPSPPSPATRSAAAASSRCAATSGSPATTRSSASRRSCSASSPAPAARSGCRGSSARPRPRTSSSRPLRRRGRGAALGLVDEVVAPDDVYDAARPGEQFANGPAYALRAAKEAIDGGLDVDLDTGLGSSARCSRRCSPPRTGSIGMRRSSRTGPARRRSWQVDPAPNPHATRGGRGGPGRPKLANVLYHDWEAEHLRREVVDLLRRALHRLRHRPVRAGWRRSERRLALRARAGAGLRHRVLPAQPDARRGDQEGARSPTSRPAWSRSRCATRSTSGSTSTAGSPTPSAALRRRHVRPRRRARRAAPHPRRRAAFREVLRVLKPGGRFVFAGEPTTTATGSPGGSRTAAWVATTTVTHLPGLRGWLGRPRDELASRPEAAALEAQVDLHTFDPADLERTALRAGACDVNVDAEELTAAWAGWPIRTVEYARSTPSGSASAGRCSPSTPGSG